MHIISTTNHVSTKSDDVTVCCEDAAGTKHQMPWVTEKNEITNPHANPTPIKPSDDNSTPADDNKPNVNTGVEGVAVVRGIAAIAGGAMIVSRKRK